MPPLDHRVFIETAEPPRFARLKSVRFDHELRQLFLEQNASGNHAADGQEARVAGPIRGIVAVDGA